MCEKGRERKVRRWKQMRGTAEGRGQLEGEERGLLLTEDVVVD